MIFENNKVATAERIDISFQAKIVTVIDAQLVQHSKWLFLRLLQKFSDPFFGVKPHVQDFVDADE